MTRAKEIEATVIGFFDLSFPRRTVEDVCCEPAVAAAWCCQLRCAYPALADLSDAEALRSAMNGQKHRRAGRRRERKEFDLEAALGKCGCEMTPDGFAKLAVKTFVEQTEESGASLDDILLDPPKAATLAATIQRRTSPMVSSYVVLKTLLRERKRGRLPKTEERPKAAQSQRSIFD